MRHKKNISPKTRRKNYKVYYSDCKSKEQKLTFNNKRINNKTQKSPVKIPNKIKKTCRRKFSLDKVAIQTNEHVINNDRFLTKIS